jgi:hypothetical protein
MEWDYTVDMAPAQRPHALVRHRHDSVPPLTFS